MNLDVQINRSQKKYTSEQMFIRFLWLFVFSYLFRFSPRTFFNYRNYILKLFGAKIGHNVHIYRSVKIAIPSNLIIGDFSSVGEYTHIYNLGLCTIGSHTTISQLSYICGGTHVYTKLDRPLIKSKIQIDSNVWISANSFIGPGVYLHPYTIVGACANVTKSTTAPFQIIGGNPASFIKNYTLNDNNSSYTHL